MAGPECPLPQLLEGIRQYGRLGIPPSALVIALPWYGHDYRCVDQAIGSPCELVPSQRAWNHSGPAGINYGDALVLLRNGSAATGLMYDHATASAWFDYRDRAGRRHQVWIDTPATLAVKIAALRDAGVRGISFWDTGDVRYGTADGAADEMWDAIGTFSSKPRQLKTTDSPARRRISTWLGPGTGGVPGNDTTKALAWIRQHKNQIGSLSIYRYGAAGADNITGERFNTELAKLGIDTYFLWAGGCLPTAGSCPRETPWDGFKSAAAIQSSVAYVVQQAKAGRYTGVDLDCERLDPPSRPVLP